MRWAGSPHGRHGVSEGTRWCMPQPGAALPCHLAWHKTLIAHLKATGDALEAAQATGDAGWLLRGGRCPLFPLRRTL